MESKKLIFFCYDFHPSESVASQRVSYWALNIGNFIENINVKVITCNKSSKSSPDNKYDCTIIKDSALALLKQLHNEEKSTVIVSGGPFNFFLCLFVNFRKHKIILDLRDPFHPDPKFKDSFIKKKLKFIFQKLFIKLADGIICINKNLLNSYNSPSNKRTAIIPNGTELFYSPKTTSGEETSNNNNFIIAGKIYGDISVFIKAIEIYLPHSRIYQFVDEEKVHKANIIPQSRITIVKPPISRSQFIQKIQEFSCGIVSSYSKDYVLPVKVFDYVAADIPMIIIGDSTNQYTELKKLFLNNKSVLFIDDLENLKIAKLTNFIADTKKRCNHYDIPNIYKRSESIKILASYLKNYFL